MTQDQLTVLGWGTFGYLTAYDLLQWCSPQLLIKQYNVNVNSIQSGVSTAESEVIASLKTKYDLSAEFVKIGTVPAYAVSVISGGALVQVNVLVPGTNFTSVPTIGLIGGGGSGSAAQAGIVNNTLSFVLVTAGGTGYSSAPAVSITGGQSADTRSVLLVKITALLAIRNILGNFENISDQMTAMFKWADQNLRDIRNGQMNLPLPAIQSQILSDNRLVSQSFLTRG